MSTGDNPGADTETGRQRPRSGPSGAGDGEATADSGDDECPWWHSPESFGAEEGILDHCSEYPSANCLPKEVDLETGEMELKVNLGEEGRNCRICHLNLVGGETELEIELGCSCKGDLAAAHKQCAETWFKIRGNNICEICGASALNVAGGQENETTGTTESLSSTPADPEIPGETRNFWQGRRLINILLVCVVLAFAISWLFHFNFLS